MPSLSAAELLSELGGAIGIPELCMDAEGCCRLAFDGDWMVELRHAPAQGRWLLSCSVHGVLVSGDGMQLLLRGNLAGSGFGGGWAAIDERGHAVLHLPLADADASGSALVQATELLLDHAERWRKRLAEGPSARRAQGPMDRWAQRI
ncbi:hypothetical protein SDC9_80148 [bioreactor metagenome]|uniref:Uncharacterized protein n=1 Tax=bioreactor metagenome TaxID=1076179 RepID=A0A644Z0N8_9ZZZZ